LNAEHEEAVREELRLIFWPKEGRELRSTMHVYDQGGGGAVFEKKHYGLLSAALLFAGTDEEGTRALVFHISFQERACG